MYNPPIISGKTCPIHILKYTSRYIYMTIQWSSCGIQIQIFSLPVRDTSSNLIIGLWQPFQYLCGTQQLILVISMSQRNIWSIWKVTITITNIFSIQIIKSWFMEFIIHPSSFTIVWSIIQHAYTYMHYNEVRISMHHTTWNHNHHLHTNSRK